MKKKSTPKYKSLLSAGILAAACMLALSGCGGEKKEQEQTGSAAFSPSMDKDAEAQIRVQGSWSNFEALEEAVKDWNEIYPNVTVEYNKVDAYYDQLSRIVSGDNAPEIAMFDIDGDYVDKDAAAEHLVDLSEIGLDTDVYEEGVLDTCKYNGTMYALNWGLRIPGFVVNTTLLKNLGLEVPKTQTEFQTVCDTLVEKGYTPIQGCTQNVYSLVMQNDRDYQIAQEEDQGELYERFNNVEAGCGAYFEKEFSTMLDMVEKGYISEDVNSTIEDIYEMSILHFFEGETPFLSFTTEGFSGMKKRETKSEKFTEEPFEYEFVSLPVCGDEPVLSRAAVSGLAIVKGSENQKWAEEFLRFLCCDEELDKMASVKGVPCVTKDGSDDTRFAKIDGIAPEKKINSDSYPVIKLVDVSFSDTLWKIACGNITDLESAEKNFEEVLEDTRY